MTSALTRMLSSPTSVDPPTTASATGTVGSPGTTIESTSLIPRPATGRKSRLLNTLTPSITKPASGPKVCATMTYSPPATGQADDSSA